MKRNSCRGRGKTFDDGNNFDLPDQMTSPPRLSLSFRDTPATFLKDWEHNECREAAHSGDYHGLDHGRVKGVEIEDYGRYFESTITEDEAVSMERYPRFIRVGKIREH